MIFLDYRNNSCQQITCNMDKQNIDMMSESLNTRLGPLGINKCPRYDFTEYHDSTSALAGRFFLKPSPNIELFRAREMSKFRKRFVDKCGQLLNITVSQDPFNRWLFAQLSSVSPTSDDPLLRHASLAVDSDVVSKQLKNNFPTSPYIPHTKRNNSHFIRQKASDWISSVEMFMFSRKFQLTTEMNIAKETWLKKSNNHNTPPEQLIVFFENLRSVWHDVVCDANCDLIRQTCDFLVLEAKCVINLCKQNTNHTVDKEEITVMRKTDYHVLVYQNDVQMIRNIHFKKLYKLFRINSQQSAKLNDSDSRLEFHRSLYTLLRRYQTLFGYDNNKEKIKQGCSYHAAAPENVFYLLNKSIGVQHECFASPFNCYFKSYCSAFPDTDGVFGSVGSFFSFHPTSGSFEVGPPYTEEIMTSTVLHCVNLLEQSSLPLSFVIFVPDWRNPLQKCQEIMEECDFTRLHFVIEGNKHAFLVGDQHLPSNQQQQSTHFVLPFATHIYILQNEKGSEKWKVKANLQEEILSAFDKSTKFSRQ